mmetsp:Transcript_1742/g.4077  ORF Transcript_1742/g.4077 Transcript_1742/m.4077 type:complete len:191 (+) Transcript_1742:142-714(+)
MKTSMSDTSSVLAFPGDLQPEEAYSRCLQSVLVVAKLVPTMNVDGRGLQGVCHAPEVYLTLPNIPRDAQGVLIPFQLLVRPVSPVDPLPVATYNARRQTHRDEVKDYLYEQSELNKLTDKVFASLDETTADHIADAGGLGMTECSLAHVMQIMRTENGRLSYKQIGDISDTLKTPFNPESGMDVRGYAAA